MGKFGSFSTPQELQAFLDKRVQTVSAAHVRDSEMSIITAEAFASANISRNSFAPTNNYKRVIIEQGVPVTDCDINEISQIADYAMSSLISDFIGSGYPAGSTGYQISASANPNDLVIGAGRLYVADSPKGGTPPTGVCLTSAGFNYSTQGPPTQGGVPSPLPALTTPSGSRTDTVWLELYVQDVGPLDYANLYFANPLTSSNTDVSHRMKAFAIVRVWENSGSYAGMGVGAISGAPFYNSAHAYYPLATLSRTTSATISSGQITDIRPRISRTLQGST